MRGAMHHASLKRWRVQVKRWVKMACIGACTPKKDHAGMMDGVYWGRARRKMIMPGWWMLIVFSLFHAAQ